MAERTDERTLQFPILIGDIGGTNARFAILVDAESAPIEFPNRADRRLPHDRRCDPSAVLDRATTVRPRSAVLAVAGPVDGDEIPLTNCPWVVQAARMFATSAFRTSSCSTISRRRRWPSWRSATEHMEKIGGGRARAGRRPRRARPRHRPRRRRPDPRLRPLDSGARRRRPYGHRAAHAARFRDFSASRADRGPHFRRADPVRPRPGQRLPRGRHGRRRRRRASPRRPRSPARRSARRIRSPRRRLPSSSPASAARPATSRWCSRARAASS